MASVIDFFPVLDGRVIRRIDEVKEMRKARRQGEKWHADRTREFLYLMDSVAPGWKTARMHEVIMGIFQVVVYEFPGRITVSLSDLNGSIHMPGHRAKAWK